MPTGGHMRATSRPLPGVQTSLSMTYSFLRNFLEKGIYPRIAVDLVQCFPANCLYGDRNGLQLAV